MPMIEIGGPVLAILMMGAITYATRITGVVLATHLAGSPKIRRVLDSLPGCAIAAILAPAAVRGSFVELVALAATVAVQWLTGRTFLALALGLAILIGGAHILL